MNCSSQSLKAFTQSILLTLALVVVGCDSQQPASPVNVVAPSGKWLGIPSAVNQVITFVHESTGWLLNKSDVSIEMVDQIRPDAGNFVADYRIAVKYGNESFETTAPNVPCDEMGIPTEESVVQLRDAVEKIKDKMKQLQI